MKPTPMMRSNPRAAQQADAALAIAALARLDVLGLDAELTHGALESRARPSR